MTIAQRVAAILLAVAGFIPAALKADPAIAHYGWELPPIAAAAANPFDIRPKWAISPADRTTPVSDMLFDNRDPRARQHHQRRFLAQGDMTVSLESVRLRADPVDPYVRAPARYKSYGFALGAAWTLGEDRFLLGAGKTHLLENQPAMLAARRRIGTGTTSLGASWIRDDHVQLHAGWRQDGAGRAANGLERLVDIAAGAPIGGSGPEFTLELLPRTTHGMSMGIEGRDATIASGDLALMGRSASHDARLALFVHGHF